MADDDKLMQMEEEIKKLNDMVNLLTTEVNSIKKEIAKMNDLKGLKDEYD